MKRPFLLFFLFISSCVAAVLWFIQTPQFANVGKTLIARYVPKDVGVEVDFSEMSIKLFPPGFSIRNPSIRLKEKNIVHLPAGSSVIADEIDFRFRPFQILSGDIRIHELVIRRGKLDLLLDDSAPKKKKQVGALAGPLNFHWDQLFQVRAEAIALEDVDMHLRLASSGAVFQGYAKYLRVAQWTGRAGLGYSLEFQLRNLEAQGLHFGNFPTRLETAECEAKISERGFDFERLKLEVPGVSIQANGRLDGNPLSPGELKASAKYKMSADVQAFLKFFKRIDPKELPKGSLMAEGEITGPIERALGSLTILGKIQGKDLGFQKWTADRLSAEYAWQPKQQGELSVKNVQIESALQEKLGGFRPGMGGAVEIDELKWTPGMEVFRIPVRFKQAHLHWLGAPALRQIYGLNFRLNGSAAVEIFLKSKKWEVFSDIDLSLNQFQLDNQRFQMNKPLSRVFKIPRIDLKGRVKVDAAQLAPQNVLVSLPHSKIRLNGKVDFKEGYDLDAGGIIRLEDLGQVAENEIRGQGSLNVRVHGPSSRTIVEIDSVLRNAYYLKLFLGDVKGKMIWDDDPSRLIFSKVDLNKNSTHCLVDGKIDVSDKDSIDIKVHTDRGNIQDYIQIFSNLTKDLSWFPSKLKGPMTGDMSISGGISFSQLKVLAQIDGVNWETHGERFKNVRLEGGYDRGKYLLSRFDAIKRYGRLTGTISYDSAGFYDWEFEAQDLALSEFDHIAQLDVPIRGSIRIQSSGHGPEKQLQSTTKAWLSQFTVRSQSMPPSKVFVSTQGEEMRLQATLMGGQGILDSTYHLDPSSESSLHAELNQFDFSPILLLLNPKSIQDRALAGACSGLVNLTFHSGRPEESQGVIKLSEYLLSRADSRFQLSEPASIRIEQGNFKMAPAVFQGKLGSVQVSLENQGKKLSGLVQGLIDNSIVEFFTPTITQALGTSRLDLSIGGSLQDPSVLGSIQLGGGPVRLASVDSPLENLAGKIQVKQGLLSVQNVQADLGGGRVIANGKIALNTADYPSLDLSANVQGPKLKIYPFQFIKVTGNLGVRGETAPYTVDGRLAVDSALSREKVLGQKKTSGELKALQYGPPPGSAGGTQVSLFKLNIDVEATRGVVFQNDLFRDLHARGELTLVNTLEAPRVVGDVEVTQGKLIFKDRVFQIQSASADFDNPTLINPSFDLNAYTDVNGIKIQLYATGRLDKMRIEFTSNPPMQESEILSLLALGLTSSDAKRLNANDLAVVQQGEAASLVLNSLDFNRDLEDKTGFHVQVEESVNPFQGVSAFRPQASVEAAAAAAAPQITIKRRLGDRLSLSAGSTVGVGTNKANQVNLDLLLNKDLSLTGVFNNYTNVGTADAQQNTQNSMGLDLKFQRRFK